MQVTVESVNNLERKMTVKVPSDKIKAEVEKRLKSMLGKVKMDGFRPGKVPLKVIRNKYESSIFHEVVGDLMQSSYGEALSQEKLNPAGSPQIEDFNPVMGTELKYIARFEVYPEISPASLEGADIKLLEVEITDADVDRTIEELRNQRKVWVEADRKSAKGDQIALDFNGKVDGEEFEGGKASNFELILGDNKMIPGFEEQLESLEKDEKKTITVKFPDEYQQKDLAGKDAEFDIIVNAVKQGELPAIDEDFIKQFGIESGSEEELRQQISENLERERDRTVARKLKDEVMGLLLNKNNFDVPSALVEGEIQALKQQAAQSMQGGTVEGLADDLFIDSAKRRVSLGLLVGEIIKQNKIELDQSKLTSMLEEMAADYHDPDGYIQYYRENPDQMAQLEGAVMEEQVVDWVKSQANNKTTKINFETLMKPEEKN